MRKFLISLFLFSSLHLYSQDVVVSPSQDFQTYLDSLNNDMMGYLDWYLLSYENWFTYISQMLADGNISLLGQSLQQTEKLQDLINNVIYYVEPQLEEIRSNSTSEIVPTLHSIEQRQSDIFNSIDDISRKVESGFSVNHEDLNLVSSYLSNLYTLQDEMYQNNQEHQQGQKEYYNSLEAAVNSLQKSLTDEVGPNLIGMSEHIAAIYHNMDYLNKEGTQIDVLNAIAGNGSLLENIFLTVSALGNNNSSNSFPHEILDDYKAIDREAEILELGWKSATDANNFQPGTVTLTSMDNPTIKGGYFEQVLQLLKADTKVDIESKETLLMILKTLNISEDNSEQANQLISDITSEDNDAKRDEQSAVDTSDGIQLTDNDKYKSQLIKIKNTAQDLVSQSSYYKNAPSAVYLNLRAQGQTYNTQYHLPVSFIDAITTIHNCMPWIYGLIIFGSLSGLFFYLLGILYQVITHYKVV